MSGRPRTPVRRHPRRCDGPSRCGCRRTCRSSPTARRCGRRRRAWRRTRRASHLDATDWCDRSHTRCPSCRPRYRSRLAYRFRADRRIQPLPIRGPAWSRSWRCCSSTRAARAGKVRRGGRPGDVHVAERIDRDARSRHRRRCRRDSSSTQQRIDDQRQRACRRRRPRMPTRCARVELPPRSDRLASSCSRAADRRSAPAGETRRRCSAPSAPSRRRSRCVFAPSNPIAMTLRVGADADDKVVLEPVAVAVVDDIDARIHRCVAQLAIGGNAVSSAPAGARDVVDLAGQFVLRRDDRRRVGADQLHAHGRRFVSVASRRPVAARTRLRSRS